MTASRPRQFPVEKPTRAADARSAFQRSESICVDAPATPGTTPARLQTGDETAEVTALHALRRSNRRPATAALKPNCGACGILPKQCHAVSIVLGCFSSSMG